MVSGSLVRGCFFLTKMADQDHTHLEHDPFSSSETVGKILSSARADWGLSKEEVAANLNLSVDIIQAVESDEYDRLPGYTFVRGYIRAYANLLRLDSDKLTAMVDVKPDQLLEVPSVKGSIKLKGRTRDRSTHKNRSFFKFLIFLLLFISLVLFGLNQWVKLDTEGLAELFRFPISDKAGDKENENKILFPSGGNVGSGN